MSRKTKHLGFKGLASKVTREYEKKGYSKTAAKRIGRATAGKVARAKKK